MASRPDIPYGVFAPKPSRQENKADATTTVACSIVSTETKAREAKTEKLRALRQAKEAELVAATPAAKPKSAKKPAGR